MTTTQESTLCRLAPEVAAEPRFCTQKIDHEKTVVALPLLVAPRNYNMVRGA